jgi:predicted peroxiredoxin
MNEEKLVSIQLWANDPYLVKELIRELGILGRMGNEVVVFMIEDGVDNAFPEGIRRNCKNSSLAEELIQGMDEAITSGVTFLACKRCHEERTAGDEHDLGEGFLGISVDAYNTFIEESMEADLTLTIQGWTQKRMEELLDERLAKFGTTTRVA